MIGQLRMLAREGNIRGRMLYVSHIKEIDGVKTLLRADATDDRDVMPHLWDLFTTHLHQAVQGEPEDTLLYAWHSGEVGSVAKVAGESYDRNKNRPGSDVLESIRNLEAFNADQLIDLGNVLAYKVMAAGKIRNHLLGIMRFDAVPSLVTAPVPLVFASLVDLEDKEELNWDERQGMFVARELNDVVKGSSVTRAVFYPALDDDLKQEKADLLIFTRSAWVAWFKALDATPRFSIRREGTCLLKNLAQVVGDEIPPTLMADLATELLPHAQGGIPCTAFIEALEKVLGRGVNGQKIVRQWEADFKSLHYRPRYEALFHGPGLKRPTKLKLTAEEVEVALQPRHLGNLRVVKVGDQYFTVLKHDMSAKLSFGRNLTVALTPVSLQELTAWLNEAESCAEEAADAKEEQG